jgi:phospholipid N-methyltransferase
MPYFMRWVLLVPRGPHSPTRLRRVLQPRNGERILEIGPGVGVHALAIAAALWPDGVLDVLESSRRCSTISYAGRPGQASRIS